MFDFFKRRQPSPAARVHAVSPSGGRQIAAHVRAASALRRRATSRTDLDQQPKRGMWVVYEARTGILTNIESGDVATVMLVDEQGLNALEIHCQAAQLRQAYFDEIPAARRPDEPTACAMGYIRRPS